MYKGKVDKTDSGMLLKCTFATALWSDDKNSVTFFAYVLTDNQLMLPKHVDTSLHLWQINYLKSYWRKTKKKLNTLIEKNLKQFLTL